MSFIVDEKDWYIRQIRSIIQVVFQLVFREEFVPFSPTVELQEPLEEPFSPDALYVRLKGMLAGGDICGAEDLLFEHLSPDEPRFLHVALDFYACLADYDSALLEACNFSHAEILSGIKDTLTTYGLSVDSLFK